ncbi:hypothetical protein Lal_00015961 [Lupinus albus]|nr:hypothetical protein Lal_00015961 [Lupinus albus]
MVLEVNLMNSLVLFCIIVISMQVSSIFSAKFGVSSGINKGSINMATSPKWAQKTITLPPHKRGCHLVTSKILKEIENDLSGFNCGLAHLFLQHTSASLTINENYDSDVRHDTETFLNRVVPEGSSAPWKHTLEGPDDMPAHIKSSMFGCALTIPITNGKLNMGTWQDIFGLVTLCRSLVYGFVSIEIILRREELLSLLMEYEALISICFTLSLYM